MNNILIPMNKSRILLANPRGFCAGVERAIAIVKQALEKYQSPVYVLHEIVHNTHVIKELKDKGAVFVEELTDIPPGALTIFSAHGVSRKTEERAKELGLVTIDATCPLVTRVHRRVSRLNKIGYDIIVVGHKGHPEVTGTCGHADKTVHVVSVPEEVAKLEVANPDKVGYVTQTTLSVADSKEILKAIKEKFANINEPERTDICYATTNRQEAVKDLAKAADIVLIVGSKNSSNSNRLKETAEQNGVEAHLVDQPDDINLSWLQDKGVIGISAGASAPEQMLQEVVACIKQHTRAEVEELKGKEETTRFEMPDLP